VTYAENTTVSVEKSKAELDALLRKHGAAQRLFGDDDEGGRAFVHFALGGRHYRLHVPLPKLDEFKTKQGRPSYRRVNGTRDEQLKLYEQACRSRWRAVVLVVKAKLEFVAMGVSTAEREFLADLLLPNGKPLHIEVAEKIRAGYESGQMPPLLGMGADDA